MLSSLLFLNGALSGFAGGFSSGLLGVSPGGGLVVFAMILLGADQHSAQGLSLLAQIFPTSTVGVRRFWKGGYRVTARWILLLGCGFVIGGIAGAYGANFTSDTVLKWSFVAYLLLLDAMLIVRGQPALNSPPIEPTTEPRAVSVLLIGTVAGLSSGFLGIGGGLATVVGLTMVLRVPQHQAQMASLVLSLLPTTAPAAWVYFVEGSKWSLVTIVGIILGLVVGTDLGARLANSADSRILHAGMILFATSMAAYMALAR